MAEELYRLFNKEGELLYVGVSKHSIARLCGGHMQGQWWRHEVTRCEIEHLGDITREQALIREAFVIKEEKPKYNISRPTTEKPRWRGSHDRQPWDPRWVTYTMYACEKLDLPEDAVIRLVKSGRLNSYQLTGGRIGFKPSEVKRFRWENSKWLYGFRYRAKKKEKMKPVNPQPLPVNPDGQPVNPLHSL